MLLVPCVSFSRLAWPGTQELQVASRGWVFCWRLRQSLNWFHAVHSHLLVRTYCLAEHMLPDPASRSPLHSRLHLPARNCCHGLFLNLRNSVLFGCFRRICDPPGFPPSSLPQSTIPQIQFSTSSGSSSFWHLLSIPSAESIFAAFVGMSSLPGACISLL